MAPRIAGEGLVDAATPAEVSRAARAAVRAALLGMSDPSLVVGFVSGGTARVDPEALLESARLARALAPGASVVMVESSVAMSSQGEREGAASASALALSSSSVQCRVSSLPEGSPPPRQRAHLAEALRAGAPAKLSVCFLAPAAHTADALSALYRAERPEVVGAGAPRVVVAGPDEAPRAVDIAVIALATRLGVAVCSSTSARLIGPWMRVTQTDGLAVLRTERGRMLDVLSEAVESQGRREPVLLAVRPGDPGQPPLLRNVAGADPSRGAVTLTDALPEGAEVAFAMRDAGAARQDHQQRMATLARGLQGAIPAAAMMFTGAGRGRLLFGQPDVDAAAFRARFAGVPMAGMHAAFGVSPWEGHPRLQLFSAVTALLYRPS